MSPPPHQDPRIDAKIAAAPAFAQPILRLVRETLHAALPDLEEAIKWGMPFFLRDGRPFAMMSAFKAHAAFGFWRGRMTDKQDDALGQFGRLTSVEDLPPRDRLIASIREHADKAPAPPRPKTSKPAIAEPAELTVALEANAAARAGFDTLPPGAQREYLQWIIDAKRDQTRTKRVETAVAQVAEGKKLNWRYENC